MAQQLQSLRLTQMGAHTSQQSSKGGLEVDGGDGPAHGGGPQLAIGWPGNHSNLGGQNCNLEIFLPLHKRLLSKKTPNSSSVAAST